jgi:hypothetical protein
MQYKDLCTGAFLYATYSFLLISNKFLMGGGGQMALIGSIPFHRAQKIFDFQGPNNSLPT